MKIAAEKIITELFENNSAKLITAFVTDEEETIGSLLKRMQITGKTNWHYNQTEIRLKLIHD